MSFIEQTAKLFANTAEFKFQAVMFGRDAFYLEGARPVKIDEAEMIFKAPKVLIYLRGEGMTVKELSGDTVAVTGRIDCYEVTDL